MRNWLGYSWVLLAAPTALAMPIIGQMSPAEPVTAERITTLAAPAQAAWTAYLQRSQALMAGDKAALAAEREGIAVPATAKVDSGGGVGMPLDQTAKWYASAEARHIADNILSYQTPAGGWGKNLDRTGPVRPRGQFYIATDNPRPDGRENWGWVGTIDNDGTTTEIQFLARVQAALPGAEGEPYRASLLKGVRYLLAAQYPNGGWPQVYPLMGGYHDALTYNDNAFVSVLLTLSKVVVREGDYAFVPDEIASPARLALAKGIDVVLKTQVVVDGLPTIWGQQHDALTLAPAGARNFEPSALSSSESAKLLEFLMRLPKPSRRVATAVHTGVAWLEAHAIQGKEWTKASSDGRKLVPKPGATPIWSRYYDVTSGKPIFGDRDKSIHDDVNELSVERRNGYAWFNTAPARTIAAYRAWSKLNPKS